MNAYGGVLGPGTGSCDGSSVTQGGNKYRGVKPITPSLAVVNDLLCARSLVLCTKTNAPGSHCCETSLWAFNEVVLPTLPW